jgi:simple sugar transport system substrate-binding protein
MIRSTNKVVLASSAVFVLALAACSSSGGKKETASGDANAAKATTMTVAMITHQAPGDTFWDIIRKGAEAASANDGVKLEYSNDPDATKQAQLIQAAIDKKVDGIAVTSPNTGALGAAIKKAVAAGIPVTMFNAGEADFQSLGAIGYFGQGEKPAGVAVGQRVVGDGGKNILCVIQEQGQQQLEDRCDGVTQGAAGAKVQRMYVNGRDDAATTTAIQAKLTQDKTVDWVVTLGAFDTNKQLVDAVKGGKVAWAIDQQPYLQGYLAVDALWLYKTNGNTIGGGNAVATGPAFIDSKNIDAVAQFAANGTR